MLLMKCRQEKSPCATEASRRLESTVKARKKDKEDDLKLIMYLEQIMFLFFWCTPFFVKKLFIFNWRIIALQYCIGFCHTSTWVSHRYTYVPSLLKFPPISHLHPTPLRCHRALGVSSLCYVAIPTGYQIYIW